MSGKQFIVIWGKKIVFVSNPFVNDKERETEYLKAHEVYDKLSYKKQKCICETVYNSLNVMN